RGQNTKHGCRPTPFCLLPSAYSFCAFRQTTSPDLHPAHIALYDNLFYTLGGRTKRLRDILTAVAYRDDESATAARDDSDSEGRPCGDGGGAAWRRPRHAKSARSAIGSWHR